MSRRVLAALLSFLLVISGCYVKKVNKVSAATAPQVSGGVVIGITTKKGDDVRFDTPGATISDGQVSGMVKKAAYTLPLDQVQRVWIQDKNKTFSTARTVGLVAAVAVGTLAVLAGVVAATKQSCPFVYSWDGNEYVFDAEPYGGAISRGLEKDDYSELGLLHEDKGIYKLRMTNEVDETQLTNMTELWVVDHPAGTRVVPDVQGKLHTVGTPYAPAEAHDAAGTDLLPWLRATDRLIWEPPAVPGKDGSLESEVVMTFPKPADARQAKLIANAATGLWGSYMIKKMVELRGREVGAWYDLVDHSQEARDQLTAWEVREELYALKIYVEEPTGWEVRAILPGTGPFISKDRIVPLDLSHVRGNTVRIRITPPAGFWALNSFAMDYTADAPLRTRTVKPATARDPQGKNLLPDLIAVDDRYLPMPNMGDTADITFPAPAQPAGEERTVFLHTRGYYTLHVSGKGDPDVKTLTALETTPGTAARFAAEHFQQWQVARLQQQK